MRAKNIWLVPWVVAIFVLGFYLFRNSFGMTNYQQFSYLAKSFLEGSLSFTESYDGWWHDAVEFNGKYYWPLGPFPAVLLMPFQLMSNKMGQIFYQGYIQSFLVVLLYGVIYRISRRVDFSKLDSHYLALGFCGGTAFLGVAMWPNSWFLAQVVTTLLIFLSINEYMTRKRYWVIGLLFGLIFATRFTASLGIVFFALEVVLAKESLNKKLSKLVQMGIAMVPFVVLIGIYNVVRFGSFFEQGYSYQNVAGAFSYVTEYGLFNPLYIVPNLYYMFINAPVPVFIEGTKILSAPFLKADPWGMGMLFTSPLVVIALLNAKWKEQKTKLLTATSIIIAIPIVLYYGIGWYQYGFRYSLDFLPFLFLILMYNNHGKTLSASLKVLIVVSALLNMYLFGTIFIL